MFGRAAAHFIAQDYKPGEAVPEIGDKDTERTISRLDKLRWSKGALPTASIRKELQRTMQRHASVFRIQEILEEGCSKVRDICSM